MIICQKNKKNIIFNNIIADIYMSIFRRYINMGWNIINMPYTILQKGSKI